MRWALSQKKKGIINLNICEGKMDACCFPETYFFNLHLAIVKGLLFDPKVKATCFLTNKTIMTAGSCQIESTSKHLSNGRLKCFTFFISSKWQP